MDDNIVAPYSLLYGLGYSDITWMCSNCGIPRDGAFRLWVSYCKWHKEQSVRNVI